MNRIVHLTTGRAGTRVSTTGTGMFARSEVLFDGTGARSVAVWASDLMDEHRYHAMNPRRRYGSRWPTRWLDWSNDSRTWRAPREGEE